MCWINLKFRCTVLFESREITGRRINDRRNLIHLVADEFPDYPRLRVAFAIDKYLNTNPQPINSTEFINCIRAYLK